MKALGTILALSAAALLMVGASARAEDRASTACPRVIGTVLGVHRGNVVTLDARLRDTRAVMRTRITLRHASSGVVAFAYDETLEYDTPKDSVSYREELPLDAPRERWIVRVTVRVSGCDAARAERTFWSGRPSSATPA